MDNKTLLKVINGQQDKIESLEDKYKYMFNNKDVKYLIDKIDDLEAKNYQIKSDLDKLINYMETEPIIDELTTKGGNNE